MNIATISTVIGFLVMGAGGAAYLHTGFVQQDRFEVAQAKTAVDIQVVAKESRLRDVEAQLRDLAAAEASRPLSSSEMQRKQQLESQYGAIVSELEKMR